MDDREILERLRSDDAQGAYRGYRQQGKDQVTSLVLTLEKFILDLNALRSTLCPHCGRQGRRETDPRLGTDRARAAYRCPINHLYFVARQEAHPPF
jgi:hypothetical protein